MTAIGEALGEGRKGLGRDVSSMVGIVRLAVGLAQGIVLYLLMRLTAGAGSWSSTHPGTFAPLVLIALFTPPLLLAGAGKMRWLTLGLWVVIAASALGVIGWHDIARQAGEGRQPTLSMFAFSAAALFIAHHLILTADQARRPVAAYPAYFDGAWMAGLQLAASIAFAGAFWLLLLLGAALFNVIGLSFLGDLLEKGWFSLPLTGLAFATAVQLTDVREGLIRGVRSIALMLLSWLLLVLTVLVGGFLAALPFTGLSGLWGTGSATALLLGAAGAMIILINAAYQDGRDENLPPRVLQIAVRAASVLLVPLIGLAAWGLALRIGQHGLTPDRIIAVACAVVGAIYAGGYAFAALSTLKGDWMKPLEPTNLVAAVAAVLTILALFTPVADPARLSVADQVSRLEAGKVSAETFDYNFLRFGSGKVGQAALDRLAASTDSAIAEKAKAAKANIEQEAPSPPSPRPVVGVLPGAAPLPEAFFKAGDGADARSECRRSGDCLAALGPSVGFPEGDVLLAQAGMAVLFSAEGDGYVQRGTYSPLYCDGGRSIDPRDLLRQGKLKAAPASRPALTLGGRSSDLTPSGPPKC